MSYEQGRDEQGRGEQGCTEQGCGDGAGRGPGLVTGAGQVGGRQLGTGSRRGRVAMALLLALALVAAACGSSDDDESSEGTSGTDVASEELGGSDDRAGNDDAVDGGTLVYGIEADSANPWVHYATSCAVSCREIFRAISDPLFIPTQQPGGVAEAQPFLLKSAEPSADFKTWTFTARDGITFHDGTPFDGEAIRYNLDVCRFSGLTGPAFAHIDTVVASGPTATVTLKMADVALPFLLRDEVCGMMFSPKWMRTLESNPLRKLDPTRVDPPTGNQAAPVGLGAFKFVSYSPGNGNSFVAEKNPGYWRKAEGLPHLDRVEFVVAVDIQSRSNGLRSGQFNIIHTANSDESASLADDGGFTVLRADDFAESAHTMLNVAEGTNPTYAALSGKDGPWTPRAPTPTRRCSTCTADGPWPTPPTASAWSTSVRRA